LDSLAAWFLVFSVPVGAAGLLLVLPVLIVRYKWARTAPELSGWPRVIDQECQLDAAEAGLRLVCGDKTVEIDVQEPAM
jgi:hypothetical protein